MRLKSVGKNPNKPMIALDEAGNKIWYFAEAKPYIDAKQITEGDEVEIQTLEQEREGVKVIVSIKKLGATTTAPAATTNSAPKCSECSYPLKDARYSKCWKCNQKAKEGGVVANSSEFKCEVCGKGLKDGKYKKCFTCNQNKAVNTTQVATTVKTEPKKSVYTLSTQESIERQNVNNAVSRSLIALQGTIDVNNIADVIDVLWKKYHSKLK